jgi:hypothetical protein
VVDGSIFPSSYDYGDDYYCYYDYGDDYYCYFSVQAILYRLHLFPSFHSRFQIPNSHNLPNPMSTQTPEIIGQ